MLKLLTAQERKQYFKAGKQKAFSSGCIAKC